MRVVLGLVIELTAADNDSMKADFRVAGHIAMRAFTSLMFGDKMGYV
jgi:hypothetical protein